MKIFNKTIGSEIVVDTGLLVNYLEGTELGEKIKEFIFKNEFISSILATPVLGIEVYYILRRKYSKEFAIETIKKLQNTITFVPLEEYLSDCGEIKAKHPFALSDCCTLGLAQFMDLKALFVHEREIDNHLQRIGSDQFTQRIIFIDDFELFK
ncbi:MAG TPA: PIN domain-containing protein [Candidatus Deferrimicrobium sp.]|nr:PIN domain-containing protein [Candidatus Deferrimicrobium sp.]